MFTGLSAFPLTPLRNDRVDEPAYAGLVQRLVSAGVDSIGALGSTGSYAYLDRDERRRVAQLSVEHAGSVPVIVGIGALRTSHVQALAEDAQEAGAAAVLLPPVTYQRLGDDEVFGLYRDVAAGLSVPLVVYDNPGTTHVTFSDELHARIAELPAVTSIKIPGVPADPAQAAHRVSSLRAALPERVSIGVSGDAFGATGLNAGCELWYTAVGGTLPEEMLRITRAAQAGDAARAVELSQRLDPLWELLSRHGSLRVSAAIAQRLGLVEPECLPRPVRGLDPAGHAEVEGVLAGLGRV